MRRAPMVSLVSNGRALGERDILRLVREHIVSRASTGFSL